MTPKTYNDGLEAAAQYHDANTREFEERAGHYDIESAMFNDAARASHLHAAKIRALKALED